MRPSNVTDVILQTCNMITSSCTIRDAYAATRSRNASPIICLLVTAALHELQQQLPSRMDMQPLELHHRGRHMQHIHPYDSYRECSSTFSSVIHCEYTIVRMAASYRKPSYHHRGLASVTFIRATHHQSGLVMPRPGRSDCMGAISTAATPH